MVFNNESLEGFKKRLLTSPYESLRKLVNKNYYLFFLWVYLKGYVLKNDPYIIKKLKVNIIQELMVIRRRMFRRVAQSMKID